MSATIIPFPTAADRAARSSKPNQTDVWLPSAAPVMYQPNGKGDNALRTAEMWIMTRDGEIKAQRAFRESRGLSDLDPDLLAHQEKISSGSFYYALRTKAEGIDGAAVKARLALWSLGRLPAGIVRRFLEDACIAMTKLPRAGVQPRCIGRNAMNALLKTDPVLGSIALKVQRRRFPDTGDDEGSAA